MADLIMQSVNQAIDQSIINLKRENIYQKIRTTSSDFQQTKNIFNLKAISCSSIEDNSLSKQFEKNIAESAYKSIKNNLSLLRSKESSIDNTYNISRSKIIDHEVILKETPEIKAIETKLVENQKQIQTFQKTLIADPPSKSVYESALKVSSLIKTEVFQLQNLATNIINDIASIKAQLQGLKNGSVSISDLQIKVTGSASSSAIDTSSLIQTNSSAVAVLGGNQNSAIREQQELIESSKQDINFEQNQEDIQEQVKDSIIAYLEKLLSTKEEELPQVQQKIETKQKELEKNEAQVALYKTEYDKDQKERSKIEKELENLIDENIELMKERLDKDPELVKYNAVEKFFNNFLQGNGNTGSGVGAEIRRHEDKFPELKEKYENKFTQNESFENLLTLNFSFRNEARASLGDSSIKTAQENQLFEAFKAKYEV